MNEELKIDTNTDEVKKIWKKMQGTLPDSAGFRIEPTALSKEKSGHEEIQKFFQDEELIKFIQTNPEIVNKILKFQRLLDGMKD